jgi:hypothetical protein
MEKIQEYYFSRFDSMIAKKWEKSHGFPCEVPERKVEIVKKKQEVFQKELYYCHVIVNQLLIWVAGTSHKRWNQNGLQELGLRLDL